MTFQTFHWRPETLSVTQSDLDAITKYARVGLKDDAIAIKCNMTPTHLRRLIEFVPEVDKAIQYGRVDMEYQAAQALLNASAAGDTKASLAILQHKAGWVAKQELDVNITSINVAEVIKEARSRLTNQQSNTIDMEDEDDKDTVAITNNHKRHA